MIRALTIRQPWAWLIVHGWKRVENRTWPTRYRGPLLIHAAATPASPTAWAQAEKLCAALKIVLPSDLPRGGFVGSVELTDCVTAHPSPWFDGPYGFVLTSPATAPFTPASGRLGMWIPEAGLQFGC